MKYVVILPDLGQTTGEARVLSWRKTVDEKLAKGDPLLEVETDKVTMDVESYVEGYLREILIAEGELATALAPVAIVTDSPDEDHGTETSQPAAAGNVR